MIDNIISLNFYNYLKEDDYLSLFKTRKEFYSLLDDNIYRILLINKFSTDFVKDVRPIIISWKDCYTRIKIFENTLDKMDCPRWNYCDYNVYWNYIKKKRNLICNRDKLYRNYYNNYYKNKKYYKNKNIIN